MKRRGHKKLLKNPLAWLAAAVGGVALLSVRKAAASGGTPAHPVITPPGSAPSHVLDLPSATWESGPGPQPPVPGSGLSVGDLAALLTQSDGSGVTMIITKVLPGGVASYQGIVASSLTPSVQVGQTGTFMGSQISTWESASDAGDPWSFVAQAAAQGVDPLAVARQAIGIAA